MAAKTPLTSVRWLVLTAMLILAGWAWTAVLWARPENITPEERALLPSYCNSVQMAPGFKTGYEKWTGVYGSAFSAFHHYCWAFIYLMRADRHSTSDSTRLHFLNNAYAEIQYVVESSPPDHMLLPEMLTKQGMILRRLGRLWEAIAHLQRAVGLDQKYWRAYAELARCYVAQGDKQKARAVLEEGLSHSPESKGLMTLLKDLGGRSHAAPAPPEVTSVERTGAGTGTGVDDPSKPLR
jgi:tetratricopeptide (TPR) repeat protein